MALSARAPKSHMNSFVARMLFFLGLLAALLGVAYANQRQSSNPAVVQQSIGPCQTSNTANLLPLLPQGRTLLLGSENRAAAPPSSLQSSPDDFKALLGYYGPYYNQDSLDGQVVVLPTTVRTL